MARLLSPESGGGKWGEALSGYLSRPHNNDEALKAGVVRNTNLNVVYIIAED